MCGKRECYRATFTEGTFDPCMCDPASISHRVVIMEITNRRPVIVVYRSLSLSGFPRGSERSSKRSRGATDKLIARPAERKKNRVMGEDGLRCGLNGFWDGRRKSIHIRSRLRGLRYVCGTRIVSQGRERKSLPPSWARLPLTLHPPPKDLSRSVAIMGELWYLEDS